METFFYGFPQAGGTELTTTMSAAQVGGLKLRVRELGGLLVGLRLDASGQSRWESFIDVVVEGSPSRLEITITSDQDATHAEVVVHCESPTSLAAGVARLWPSDLVLDDLLGTSRVEMSSERSRAPEEGSPSSPFTVCLTGSEVIVRGMTGVVSESTEDGLKVSVGNRVLEVRSDEEIWFRGTLSRTRCTEVQRERNHLHTSTCAYEALRSWRLNRARLDGVSAFMIAHNTTLQAIAVEQPNTLDDLLGICGIGPVKLERYGLEILAVIGAESGCCRGTSSSEQLSTSSPRDGSAFN